MDDQRDDLQSQPELPVGVPATTGPVTPSDAAQQIIAPPVGSAAGHADEVHHSDGRIEHPRVRFEPTDISFRGVLAVIVVAACLLPLLQYLILLFFHSDQRRQTVAKRTAFPLAAGQTAGLPVEPRLEQLDRLAGVETPDARRQRAAEEAKLRTYGETDEAGFVHVPIDWAITQTAKRLPTKPPQTGQSAKKDHGLPDAGEPNSGRLLRGD